MRDATVIGGGPSGLAAAVWLAEKGYDVAVVEVMGELGGMLTQCIHDGFGTRVFGEALSGPEFSERLVKKARLLGLKTFLNTYVKEVRIGKEFKEVVAVSPAGVQRLQTRVIVYAIGCRERNGFEIRLGGARPAGVYTAGMVQRLVNLYGVLPGRRIVIMGGGDVGMIVARHLHLEGVESILMVFPEAGFAGLPRNVQQCILDFGIPFRPRTVVKKVIGKERVEGVVLTRVDEKWNPVEGTEEFHACDTVVLALGLVPYTGELKLGVRMDPATRGPEVNEFFETSVQGVFAVGNLVQVFDYVDDAFETACIAARGVEKYLNSGLKTAPIRLSPGENVRMLTPQRVEWVDDADVPVFLRPAVEKANVRIVVRNREGRVLGGFFKRYVRPSTLERIEVPRSMLSNLQEVSIDIAED